MCYWLAVRASTAPNPVFEWLNRAAAAADWGLPEAGPAAALLRLDASDWEPPGYCPVHDMLKSARAGGPAPWHNNIRSSQDPLTGLLAMEVCNVLLPQCTSCCCSCRALSLLCKSGKSWLLPSAMHDEVYYMIHCPKEELIIHGCRPPLLCPLFPS